MGTLQLSIFLIFFTIKSHRKNEDLILKHSKIPSIILGTHPGNLVLPGQSLIFSFSVVIKDKDSLAINNFQDESSIKGRDETAFNGARPTGILAVSLTMKAILPA